MGKLLGLQIRNLFTQKVYYFCLILFVLMGPVTSFTTSLLAPEFAGENTVMSQFSDIMYREISMVSIIFVAVFACFDFGEGTTKNIIARGYSKKQFLVSKYISSLIGLLVMYVVDFIACIGLFGANGFGFESEIGYMLICALFKVLAFNILYVTVSFALEKSAPALIACLFGPTIIQSGLFFIDEQLNNIEISKYWITNLTDGLLEGANLNNLTFAISMYAIYMIIIVWIGMFIANRKEIK